MATFITIGYGERSGYDRTSVSVREAAHEHDAVLYAPHLPAKTLPDLGPEPLPKALNRVAAHLLGRITAIAGPPTSLTSRSTASCLSMPSPR